MSRRTPRFSFASPALASCLALLTLGASATAQLEQHKFRGDDMRDSVELKSGKTVRGRVLQQFDPSQVIVLQGDKRVEIRPVKIHQIQTVRDRLRQFFEEREGRDHSAAETHWEMCQWAHAKELFHLARVEAYAALARDESHEGANTYLNHKKKSNGEWRWRLNKRLVSKKQFDKRTAEIGSAFELRSEAFFVQTNADLLKTTNAIVDLERLHLWWLDEYGSKLELDEIVEPLPIRIYAERDNFPGLTSVRRAYFLPNPHNEKSFLFYEEDHTRPTELFGTVTQHILYNSLARDADPGGPKARFCDWLELGLAQWVESQFHGEAGLAEVGAVEFDPQVAAIALEGRRYSLKNMVHLTVNDHFYTGGSLQRRTGRNRAETHWAAVHAFTTFLLDEKANPGLQRNVWEYLYSALRKGRGDSSSAFDKAIGREIEEFEKPWHRWLTERATPGAPK